MTQHVVKEYNMQMQKGNEEVIQINEEMDERDVNLIHYALSNHFLFKDKTDMIMYF